MLIYYFINCALLPSWEQKSPFFARGLKLCKTLDFAGGLSIEVQIYSNYPIKISQYLLQTIDLHK